MAVAVDVERTGSAVGMRSTFVNDDCRSTLRLAPGLNRTALAWVVPRVPPSCPALFPLRPSRSRCPRCANDDERGSREDRREWTRMGEDQDGGSWNQGHAASIGPSARSNPVVREIGMLDDLHFVSRTIANCSQFQAQLALSPSRRVMDIRHGRCAATPYRAHRPLCAHHTANVPLDRPLASSRYARASGLQITSEEIQMSRRVDSCKLHGDEDGEGNGARDETTRGRVLPCAGMAVATPPSPLLILIPASSSSILFPVFSVLLLIVHAS